MSVRVFAAHLGVAVSSVTHWERRGDQISLRHETQEILDRDLDQATNDIRARFHAMLATLPLQDAEREQATDQRAATVRRTTATIGQDAPGRQFDRPRDTTTLRGRFDRTMVTSPAHLREVVAHLREQWHALVRTDNLLGPRFALAGVLDQLAVVEALRSVLRDKQRIEVVQLGAQYAESAAWLYEEAANMDQARHWTSRAMEWAYEGDDERMLAWTIFRRSQQAAAISDPAQVIGLAQAARRKEEQLAAPTRAAIRVQEAYGHALDGNEQASQRLLDEAHTWAASDTVGDAHEGHGSYCTPSYIEIQRGTCWLTTGKPRKAIALYEQGLYTLPAVYHRNRAAGLSRLAAAYLADGQLEQAANTAHAALPVARSVGSRRIVAEIKTVGAQLAPHRPLQGVAALLDSLTNEEA